MTHIFGRFVLEQSFGVPGTDVAFLYNFIFNRFVDVADVRVSVWIRGHEAWSYPAQTSVVAGAFWLCRAQLIHCMFYFHT